MSDELFEVAFSGQMKDSVDPAEVKARIAKMFHANETKLAQLFSGKRLVIKKNIDRQTANKYQTAFERAGAICEVNSLSASDKMAPEPIKTPTPASPSTPSQSAAEPLQPTYTTLVDYGDVALPPQLDPLGISAEQIDNLSATVAPAGSELQAEIREVAEPVIDISELDMAPVGSIIGSQKKDTDPPPPDTSGISMAD